ncbi:MAG: PKD domain-containing protein, partial [Bacteroidota bacterium]
MVCVLTCTDALSTHLVGGEVYYEHMGNNVYGVTLKVYRDCSSNNTNNTQYDQFASVGVFIGGGLYEELVLDLEEAVVNFVPVVLENPCFSLPPDVCVEEAIYYGEVFLPFGPTYDIIYERCCRNPTIVNIISPEDVGATFIATVPGSSEVSIQNSSAYFNNLPPVALCTGAQFFFDHGATDPDQDSLSYEFCTPYLGGTPDIPQPAPPNGPPYTNLAWNMGYSSDYPIDANPAFEIDPETGYITGTPTMPGQYVIGVCVTEWRNGIPINTINRDFQFNVTVCDPTVIAAIPNQTQFCDGLTFEFANNSVNGDSFVWDFGDPNSDDDISTSINPVYTYSDTGVYEVTLIANPGWSCADTTSSIFAAYPLIIPAILQEDFACQNDNMLYDFAAGGEFDSDATFSWSFENANIQSADGPMVEGVDFFDSEVFVVELTVFDNGCSETTAQQFTAPPRPVASITTQSLFCQGLEQTFSNQSTDAFSYQW